MLYLNTQGLFIETRFMNMLTLMIFWTKIGQSYAQMFSLLGCFGLGFFLMGIGLQFMTRKLDQEQTNIAVDKEVKMLA